jgi:hypothetical protein
VGTLVEIGTAAQNRNAANNLRDDDMLVDCTQERTYNQRDRHDQIQRENTAAFRRAAAGVKLVDF